MEIVSTPYPKQSNITEKDYLKNKSDKNIKDVNKKNKFIFKSTPSKNNNDDKNNQIEYNCNCIGKYSYKNTEAITIINNKITQMKIMKLIHILPHMEKSLIKMK